MTSQNSTAASTPHASQGGNPANTPQAAQSDNPTRASHASQGGNQGSPDSPQSGSQSSPDLPGFLEPMLVEQYGPELAAHIVSGYRTPRASSLRANALRSTRDEVAAALSDAGIAWMPVPWYADAFVVGGNAEKSLRELALYDEGGIYLQSLSSMLPPLVLGAQPDIDILDMCAAPGGKTTQLAALGGAGTRITACELHAPRAEKLEHNLRKQGAGNVVVMRTDARKLDDFFSFDRILLDAPCSGSGTLRAGDPKLHARFTQALIQKSRKSQAALLDKALALLKPGGTLVYSTCSVLACENEDIVRTALKKAAKRGSYTLEPVSIPEANLVPAEQLAAKQLAATQTAAAPTMEEADVPASSHPVSCGDAPGAATPGASSAAVLHPAALHPVDLPILPTTLEGTLCVCPTALFEGFFIAKIKRHA